MGSLDQNIYLSLPRVLQNLAITLYGYKEYKTRYDQSLDAPFDSIPRHHLLPYEAVRALQNTRLCELVLHAEKYVPYYQDLFKNLGIEARDVNADNFTGIIPALEKAEVVAEPERFVSTHIDSHILRLFTSGTSGSPMPITCTAKARAINYAFFRNMLLRYGCDVNDQSATFAGRILFNGKEKNQFWRKDSYNNTLLLSSYHITENTIPLYINALESWKPKYIDSYPSAISEIARFINENNIKHNIAPSFILTSSETLSEQQRDHLTKAFSCKILDHYGCTEMAVSAYTLPDGRYHLDPLYSLIEFEPASLAGSSSLICTGLLNTAMPLLRYKIGDTVSNAATSKEQPFYNQTFTAVLGREDDLVITSDGRRIGRLDPAFKGLSGIKQSQIIQNSNTELEVLIVLSNNANREDISKILAANLISRTSHDMDIKILFVESIPRTRSGKFKSVVSRIKP